MYGESMAGASWCYIRSAKHTIRLCPGIAVIPPVQHIENRPGKSRKRATLGAFPDTKPKPLPIGPAIELTLDQYQAHSVDIARAACNLLILRNVIKETQPQDHQLRPRKTMRVILEHPRCNVILPLISQYVCRKPPDGRVPRLESWFPRGWDGYLIFHCNALRFQCIQTDLLKTP